ncbi:MAG: orotidine 5'-phosphate decarboxylase [Candidatus Moranbacteria bacterium]|nr:orotidine 5'-phosphate decarboxylase [Candidatus Moranbacteria bacterium]
MNNKDVRRVIWALDGMGVTAAQDVLDKVFVENSDVNQMIAMIKLNDMALLGEDAIISIMNHVPSDTGLFIDGKWADVSGTMRNIAKRYAGLSPSIVTVRESIHWKSLLAIRDVLPQATIALVSALTDISEADFLRDYGMVPREYIARHLEKFQRYLGDDNSLGASVCSPLEASWLSERFPHIKLITPSIRSLWMKEDHQQRTLPADEAIKAGAKFLVMGSQLTKGNPEEGISAVKSRQMTFDEIVSAVSV